MIEQTKQATLKFRENETKVSDWIVIFFAKADTDCTEFLFHCVCIVVAIKSNAFLYNTLKSETEILADYCCLISLTLPLHKTFHFSL